MKKIYLTLLFAMIGIMANAQCTPDPNYTKPGLYPNRMPDGIVGTWFEQTLTLIVPKDTQINYSGNLYNIKVDSATVVEISDLPSSFSYICDNARRTWAGGAKGCAKMTGIPMASDTGKIQIYVKVRTFFKIVGLSNQLDQLDSSTIDFLIKMPTALQELEKEAGLKAFPNPAQNILHVVVSNYNAKATYEIYNIMGQLFPTTTTYSPNTGEVTFNIGDLLPGVYFVKGENEGRTYQARFIKE
jgi:hypothetical protein